MPLLPTGRGRPRGRRGRGSRADSRQVGEEGLVTLTSMILGNAEVRYFATVQSISSRVSDIVYKIIFLHVMRDYQYIAYTTFLQSQNFRIKKNISVGKKGGVPAEPQRPVPDLSPSKQIKEEPKMDTTPYSPPAGTSELLPTSDERKEEQKIRAEVVPYLCGMRSVRDITNV